MPYLTSNRRLLDEFRRGEPRALREVYLYYAPTVARALRAERFKAPLELADGLQEVFARAFADRARLGYDGISPYGAYLCAIARHVAIDAVRRRSASHAAAAELAEVSELAPASEGPDVLSEEAEARRLVEVFEERLSAKDRLLFNCRFRDGQTQEGAAEALGLTRIQVRRAEARLRAELLEYLKSSGYLEHAAPPTGGLVPLSGAPLRRRRTP